MMDKKTILTYALIFAFSALLLMVLPMRGPVVWQPEVVISLSAMLYTLLVFLSCRLVGISRPEGIVSVAVFLALFLPRGQTFTDRNIEAVMELTSQCIVPFFISQYHRIREKDFRHIYVLMVLMGIFCSYTHDGITIPLCLGFLWMWFIHRDRFFSTACWPMVVGFVIGTSISIWQALTDGTSSAPADLRESISRTTLALQILWDTKIFMISILLTAYLSLYRWGRRILLGIFRRHTLLSCCATFSFCTLPFAPLGLDNAVTGVCFFCMYWSMLIGNALAEKFYYGRKAVAANEQTNNN